MAEVTEEEIVGVFGKTAPDYSDISPEIWDEIVASLYGIEKREFDAFVDVLTSQSKEGGTPNIRRSLVKIYEDTLRDVRESPGAAGRTEREIRDATNRVFSNLRPAVRNPTALRESMDKGLLQWSLGNRGRTEEWAEDLQFESDRDPLFTVGEIDMMAGQANPLSYQREPSAAARYTDLRGLDPGATERSLRDNRPGPLGAPINTAPRRYDSKTGWVDSPPTPFRLDFSGQGLEPTFDPFAPDGARGRMPLLPEASFADRRAAEDFLYNLTPEQRARFGPPGEDGQFTEQQITSVINARRGRTDPNLAFPTPAAGTEVESITPEVTPQYVADMMAGIGPRGVDGNPLIKPLTLMPEGETIEGSLTSLRDPRVTATETESVVTPSGAEEVTESVSAPAAPVPGAAPPQTEGGGMSPMSLGGALIGGAGIAAAIGNTIADFRTTAALEDQLAASAAGDTIARREGALAGSQAQRNIMATSMGRRDISPALALRNAQMAGSRTLSDVYGQAAIASARERRESEAQLAQLRKQRWNTLFGGLTRTAGDVGALLATQGAAEETANMNKRLTDLEASNLNQVGLAPGQRRR